jgi:hypothetical protein
VEELGDSGRTGRWWKIVEELEDGGRWWKKWKRRETHL